MALSGTTNKQSFTATASQTDFVFSIPFFNATRASDSGTTLKFGDIKVTRQAASGGVITALTPADSPSTVNQFKVTATNGDPGQGATITIGSGATVNDIYVVERDVAYTQDYDLQEGATIDPTALNKAFDRVVAQNQQQSDQFTRTVTFPSTDADTITYNVNDSSANRANKFLGFDSDGDVTTLAAVSGSASVDTGRGLQLVGGQIGLKDDGVTQAFMADDAIGADQLASNSVVSASIVDGSIATGDIADDAVTYAKLQDVTTNLRALGGITAGTVAEIPIDTDLTSITDSHSELATAKAIKAYIDSQIASLITGFATDGTGSSAGASNGKILTIGSGSDALIIKTFDFVSDTDSFQTVVFPTAFPNNCFGVAGIGGLGSQVTGITASQFQLARHGGYDSSITINCIAIGN
jgi:hypothetical protein